MVAPKLIVIVGETASGKSAMAMKLAKELRGEIISADSRTVYKYMDIGTSKPTKKDQSEVKHHLIDLIEPNENFSAALFKELAGSAIEKISQNGNMPIIVGGTGLYVDGLLYDYSFLPLAMSDERDVLNNMSVAQLQEQLKAQGISLPVNSSNPRHLIRAIETNGAVHVKKGIRKNTLILGIKNNKTELSQRILQRVTMMVEQGLESEVSQLVAKYGWEAPGMSAVGYKEWLTYFVHKQSLDATINNITLRSIQYAKRQRTWFRRNPNIEWIENYHQASNLVTTFLQQ